MLIKKFVLNSERDVNTNNSQEAKVTRPVANCMNGLYLADGYSNQISFWTVS